MSHLYSDVNCQCNKIVKMRKIRDNDEEAQPLVINDDVNINSTYQTYYPTLNLVIMKGVSMHLAKWPSHLFGIFMAVCIVSIALMALTFVTIIFFTEDRKPRISRDVEIEEYPNVYCIKHASHPWTQDQLCAIESSAREFPDLNVYLINLHQNSPETPIAPVNTSLTLNFDATKAALSALTDRYTNVHIIDIVTSTFFKKSILRKVYKKFDWKQLEIAVKSQLLWTYSGIALNPLQMVKLKYLRSYLCKSHKLCKPMRNAAISTDGSVQVSPIPCHTFFELFMKHLAGNYQDEPNIVNDAYKDFCYGREKCVGVEILNNPSRNISPDFICPVLFPTALLSSKVNVVNLTHHNAK